MKNLLTWYKALPPQMQMLIGLAGFATPIGIIYSIAYFLHLPPMAVIFGGLIIVGLISAVAFGLPKLFGRSARKRAKKMEEELGRGEAGPVSMDLRAAIKANNEKFFTAIKDLRKLGISVYDLPWYVVIGDSGCGKTKLINEGGLTFSTGKPEGYQLGTLNYNWWFTEDAIFIDMAGRLCNPQEDADHREWDAFLKTVGVGRRGFPINGVVCCVSAEHLLQDPAEKHEADANTMLERLRDLQSKLGVTFATYLVITKCDKIVGFMQFFDRAERDITIKNQIFGWSRPGDFGELRDPEVFARDFDGVYGRLNELRLRRLNDELDEHEIGMAYSFPEEFRQFKDPLLTYVRTLFPAIKSPRAIKNLIFRGVYFTSATQQGGLILRHLSERLGADAAGQFPPLESLYPRPRPHFVKDLLVRKVFPEQGLVFRNEKEVVRNRKLARTLTVTTAVVTVLLAATLIVGSVQFGRVMQQPREDAGKAPDRAGKPIEALTTVGMLSGDIELLRSSKWTYVLSMGVGAREPVEHLTKVQVRLFEQGVLRAALMDIDTALRTAPVAVAGTQPTQPADVPLDRFLDAVRGYVAWYGCAKDAKPPAHLDAGTFDKLLDVLPKTGVLGDRTEALPIVRKHAAAYFTTLAGGGGWENPARLLLRPDFNPPLTLQKALLTAHKGLAAYADLTPTHPNETIREWARLLKNCRDIEDAYGQLLAAADRPVQSGPELDQFRKTFSEQYDRLRKAAEDCEKWGGPTSRPGILRIPALRPELVKVRQDWLKLRDELREALTRCPSDDPGPKEVAKSLVALIDGDDRDFRGLDRVLADNLKRHRLSDRDHFAGYYDQFENLVSEVHAGYSHILAFKPAGDAPTAAGKDDVLGLDPQAKDRLLPLLEKVSASLRADSGSGGPDTPESWVGTLRGVLGDTGSGLTIDPNLLSGLAEAWKPAQLKTFITRCQELLRKGQATFVLKSIETSLAEPGLWTLAQLAPDWSKTERSSFTIATPARPAAAAAPQETTPAKPKEEPAAAPAKPRVPTLFGTPGAPAPAATPTPAASAPATPVAPTSSGQVPNCARPEFFTLRAQECVQLVAYLNDLKADRYFALPDDKEPRSKRAAGLLLRAWQRYCEGYLGVWNDAYTGFALSQAKRLRGGSSWDDFAAQLRPEAAAGGDLRDAVTREYRLALAELLHAVRWPAYSPDQKQDVLRLTDAYFGASSEQLAAAWDAAAKDRWKQGGFARAALAPGSADAATRPWDAVAAALVAEWENWCRSVADTKVPRNFDPSDSPTKPKAISWDGLSKSQQNLKLTGETLTEQLTKIQTHAQQLLSAELTSRYVTIQDDQFKNTEPYDGWPYTNKDGQGAGATDTVEFSRFTKFLLTVQRAEDALQALEDGLPTEDPATRDRRAFLRACEEWREFLELKGVAQAGTLQVSVWLDDPFGDPRNEVRVDDTPQLSYGRARLSLGLRLQGGEGAAVRPLEFGTSADQRGQAREQKATWEWAGTGTQPDLTFELTGGLTSERNKLQFPSLPPQVVGRGGPLALCAYLHRHGLFAKGSYFVTHTQDLLKAFDAVGKPELKGEIDREKPIVGLKFVFHLQGGRALPTPVPKLVPAKAGP